MNFLQDASIRIVEAMNRCGISKDGYVSKEIPGDLSPRRYQRLVSNSRVFSEKFSSQSIIAMVFDSIKPPEAEAQIVRTSDEAFLELADFFSKSNLPVPIIYFDARDIGIVLLEDLGSKALIELVRENNKQVPKFYSEAVALIHQIQAIPKVKGFFAFERSFDQAIFLREMNQFTEFVLSPDLSKSELELIDGLFLKLSSEILSFHQVLVHRDFHSWNLMVDQKGRLRLIDFQDALMGSRSYDLVALVHERDIDLLLPQEVTFSLEDQFFAFYNDNYLKEFEYPRVQLQRDLKVSGLFMKVKKLRGLNSYAEWVPGTLSRINRTLELLSSQNNIYKEFKNFLSNKGVLN